MTPVFMPAEARDAQSFFEIASAQPYAAQWSAQAFEAEIKNNFAKVFKLEAGGKAAAFICFRAAYETGELTNFAVDKRQERKGYGALLLKAGLAALKAQGVKQVTLEVNENNRAALGLYIRFNFKQIGARKKFYDNEQNAVLMKGVL